jgi:hypothetical protein
MAINQISSANTFEQWLIATQQLISFANSITDSGGTFTSNTSEYVITGNLSVGGAVTAPTVNTDVIIFDDGTRLSSNVQIVNGYAHANGAFNHANGAFNKANGAYSHANAAYDTANTINANLANSLTTNTVVANTITANVTISTNTFTANVITIVNTITTDNLTANLITAVDINTTSDIALKDNIEKISNSLEVLEKITGFSFNWKSDGVKSYGVSAQQIESILPELVRTRQDGFKGVNYLNLIAFLIEAVKELKKDIMEIKKDINKE